MTLGADGEKEQATAPKKRWRSHPTTEIVFAWTGLVWAAPIVSILAILASETHSQNFSIIRFLVMSILNYIFFLPLALIVIPLSLIVVFLVENHSIALDLAFWSSLISAHVFRFLMARAIADMFFTGLTGPGVGPSLDVLCLPPVDSEFELECSKLSSIKLSNVMVIAFFSLILFALDVVRTNMRIRNVIAI